MNETQGLVLAKAAGCQAGYACYDPVVAARGVGVHTQKGLRLARVVSHCNSSRNTGVMAPLHGRPPICPGFSRSLSTQWCVKDLHFTPRRRLKSASYRCMTRRRWILLEFLVFAYQKSSYFLPALVAVGVLDGVVQQIQLAFQ
jgi:hypothetical protein